MKSYTDLEQSKKLAEFLPIESADMWWSYYYDIISDTGEYDKEPMLHKPVCDPDTALPCWSLASLLEVLPDTMIGKDNIGYVVMVETMGSGLTTQALNSVDACVEMILKLHELKLL